MGKSIYEGRYTIENDQDIVVFLIGMRINKDALYTNGCPFLARCPV